MQKNAKRISCLAFSIMLLIACSGTELTKGQAVEPVSVKPVSDILVIVIADKDKTRRSFERRFVTQLKSAGVDAVSSADAIAMPPDLKLKKEVILDTVSQHGNDAVMITHLAGIEEKDIQTRADPGSGGFYGYYGRIYRTRRAPGYSSTSTTIRLETNLYDVKTEKLIWSGQTKTWNKDSQKEIMNDVIAAVIKDLQKSKLLTSKK